MEEQEEKIQSDEIKRRIRLSEEWELHVKGKLKPHSRAIGYWIAIYGVSFQDYIKGKALALTENEVKLLIEALQEIQKELEQRRQDSEGIEEI